MLGRVDNSSQRHSELVVLYLQNSHIPCEEAGYTALELGLGRVPRSNTITSGSVDLEHLMPTLDRLPDPASSDCHDPCSDIFQAGLYGAPLGNDSEVPTNLEVKFC